MPRAVLVILLVSLGGSLFRSAAQVTATRDQDVNTTVADTASNQPKAVDVEAVTSGVPPSSEEKESRIEQNSMEMTAPLEESSGADRAGTISVSQLKLSGKAREALHKAVVAVSKKRLADAARYVERALALYPRSSEALTFRASLEAANEESREQAKEDAEKAVEYDPNYAAGYIVLGSLYNYYQRFDDASRALDRAITLSPASWQGHYEMSIALVAKGDFLGGLREAERSSRLDSQNDLNLHIVRAYAYMGLKNPAAATAELEAVRKRQPNNELLSAAQDALNKFFPDHAAHTDMQH